MGSGPKPLGWRSPSLLPVGLSDSEKLSGFEAHQIPPCITAEVLRK